MVTEPRTVSELRRKVRELERALAKYGFDERRGIETYKVSEIKKLLLRTGSRKQVMKTLKELIETQEKLYQELYRIADVREIAVDTDTPEKRLKEIKDWLEGRRENKAENLFPKAVLKVLGMVKRGERADAVLQALRELYKRDYDRFRVVEFILSLCNELEGKRTERTGRESLEELVELMLSRVSKLGVNSIIWCARRRLRV